MKKNTTKIFAILLIISFLLTNLSSCCCPPCQKLFSQDGQETPVPPDDTGTTPEETPVADNTGEETPVGDDGHKTLKKEAVKIDALYYCETPDGPGGGTSEVIIEIAPNPEKTMRVGFYEEEVQGTGDMWRSSGWMAVVFATMLLGKDPTKYKFSMSVEGVIDGPSAGCLMTVGVLAALRGEQVKEDATMTGTINPDGTVGPVGGIAQKLEGAKDKGKKLVLIPVGKRYDVDAKTGNSVDLVERGKKLGLEVKEVSNIYDAYEMLTGNTLPVIASSTKKPQLQPKAFDRLKGKAKEWYSRYEKARNEYVSLPEEYQALMADYVPYVDNLASKADKALSQGMASVAYNRASSAAIEMESYVLTLTMMQRYQNGGLDDVIDYLNSKASVKTELGGLLDRIKAEDISTSSDAMAIFTAYSDLVMAEGLIVLAESTIAELQENASSYTEEELTTQLLYTAMLYSYAEAGLQQAKDALDAGKGYGDEEYTDNKEEISQLADILSKATNANIAYFDSTIINEYAEAYGEHPNNMKFYFMMYEPKYLLTTATLMGANALSGEFSDETESAPMVTGYSLISYILSAQLIAKYYSLGFQYDENGNFAGLENEKALIEMLDFAERRACEMINLNGEENSTMAIFHYENARVLKQGDVEEQLEALGEYWSSITLSQLQAYLTGKLAEASQDE